MLIVSLDQYIVVVALPEIGHRPWLLRADAAVGNQRVRGGLSGFLLLGGRAADVLGPRRVLVAGLGLYAVASLTGGLAPARACCSPLGRCRGSGGALVFPATLSLVNTTFAEGRERNRAVSDLGRRGRGRPGDRGAARRRAHPTLGWEAVFFVNVPLAGQRRSLPSR